MSVGLAFSGGGSCGAYQIGFAKMIDVLKEYIYPHRHIKGKTCIDGDFSDKTPYRPLADAGCRNIMILHLNTEEEAGRPAGE